MRFVEGLAISEIRRRMGLDRDTIERAEVVDAAEVFASVAGSKLDRFKDRVHELLREDPYDRESADPPDSDRLWVWGRQDDR